MEGWPQQRFPSAKLHEGKRGSFCKVLSCGPVQCGIRAGVAQLVEQRIRNAKVEGSTPFTGTKESTS